MVILHNPEREKEQNKISLRTKAGLIAEMMEHGPVYSQVVLWERTCASPAGWRIETLGRWAKKVEKLKTSKRDEL
jgi:hypothetical protein